MTSAKTRMSWNWIGDYPVFVYTRFCQHNTFSVKVVKGKQGDQNALGYGPNAPAWKEYIQRGMASRDDVVAEAFKKAKLWMKEEQVMKLKHYVVEWQLDTKADSPISAAMNALDILRDPIGGPGLFVVMTEGEEPKRIDLTAIAEDFPFADWQAAVAAGETRLGYTDWVEKNLEEE